MARSSKPRSRWVCSACGESTSGWFGRCPSCGAWSTIREELELDEEASRLVLGPVDGQSPIVPIARATDDLPAAARLSTGLAELDRVLGGGLVPGSAVLLGGAPGIGKSTLLLQACAGLAAGGRRVLYASGEESVAQVAARARRLGATAGDLMLLAETRSEAILAATAEHEPAVVVVDSVQAVYSAGQDGLPGNLGQIRTVAAQLVGQAKRSGAPVLLVGHVTKDGQLAGPRLLEHLVDTVLSFEGDEERATRMLRATKNRFGSTQELGVFEMTGEGLREIENPSAAFLAERPAGAVGSCVTATIEGSRPLLLEIQALIGRAGTGSPRRICVGTDPGRVAMLLAVLDRHAGLFVLDQDVFVNVAGGLRIAEPAADLAALLAIASSHRGEPVPTSTLAVGEVGLSGELRRVPRLEARLAEAARLGFARAIVPPLRGPAPASGIEVAPAATVAEAITQAFC